MIENMMTVGKIMLGPVGDMSEANWIINMISVGEV
jgi:hypothetical protein